MYPHNAYTHYIPLHDLVVVVVARLTRLRRGVGEAERVLQLIHTYIYMCIYTLYIHIVYIRVAAGNKFKLRISEQIKSNANIHYICIKHIVYALYMSYIYIVTYL